MIKARDKQVFEILEELKGISSDEMKVQHLKQHYSDHNPLHYVLKFNYCDTIQSVLPEGMPPFNTEEIDGPAAASLWQYLRVFPSFVKSAQSQKMKLLQIERLFIEMLEAVDPKEARAVCLAKDRNLESEYSINVNVARNAFPQLGIQSSAPVREKTADERATELLEVAESKKAQAKILQTEARQLIKEAKALTDED